MSTSSRNPNPFNRAYRRPSYRDYTPAELTEQQRAILAKKMKTRRELADYQLADQFGITVKELLG